MKFELTLLNAMIVIVTLGVLVTLFSYSKEGDIRTFTNGAPTAAELAEMYPTKDLVVDRLHDLLIYKESYVRWNRYMMIAMFASLVMIVYYQQKFTAATFLVSSVFLFACIDLPNRWAGAHVQKGVIKEASTLYGIYGGYDGNEVA